MRPSLPIAACVACMSLFLFAPAAQAHHSFAAEFDSTKQVTLKGKITKVEWTNPHIYFYMDVLGADGKSSNWAIEAGAPNVLYRQGWRPDSLKIGDQVTVIGSRARNGMDLANAISVVLADGRCVLAGTSGPGGTATECAPNTGAPNAQGATAPRN